MLNVVPKPQTNKNLIQKHTNPKYASLKSAVEDAFSMPLKSQAPPSEACVCVYVGRLSIPLSLEQLGRNSGGTSDPIFCSVCVCVCVKQKNG